MQTQEIPMQRLLQLPFLQRCQMSNLSQKPEERFLRHLTTSQAPIVSKSMNNNIYSHSLFKTASGYCAIVFRNKRVCALFLPGQNKTELKSCMFHRFPEATSVAHKSYCQKTIEKIVQYFDGQQPSLAHIRLDLSDCPPFHQKIYEVLQKTQPGTTVSYKSLADLCDRPKAARAVGQAMAANPIPLLIPCHRVVKTSGELGNFSAVTGVKLKAAMLKLENVVLNSSENALELPRTLKELDLGLAAQTLAKQDPDFKPIVQLFPVPGLKIDKISSPFQALLESIVHQQLTGKAATTIFGRLASLFSGNITPMDIVRATDDELRSAGLSGAKVLAMRDLAQYTAQNRLPTLKQLERMPNEEVIAILSRLRGIGRWTIEMILIFKLGRADILAKDDYGLQKGLAVLRGTDKLPTPKELMQQALKWKPYCSIAAWYLWRAAEMGPKLIKNKRIEAV